MCGATVLSLIVRSIISISEMNHSTRAAVTSIAKPSKRSGHGVQYARSTICLTSIRSWSGPALASPPKPSPILHKHLEISRSPLPQSDLAFGVAVSYGHHYCWYVNVGRPYSTVQKRARGLTAASFLTPASASPSDAPSTSHPRNNEHIILRLLCRVTDHMFSTTD